MPTVAYYSDDDTEQYTNLLFTELVHERLLEQEGREVVESDPNLEFMYVFLLFFILSNANFVFTTRQLHNDELMKQLGRDLRIISEEFARSSERKRVLARADKVNLQNITYEEFRTFLNELFSEGVSREQVVVMLFFCSDMVVRAYHNPLANFQRLFSWFLEYIINKVCDWVKDHGGWVSTCT